MAQSNLTHNVSALRKALGEKHGWANMDWTPEGKLLYGAFIDRSLTIWAMHADGGDQNQLISTGYIDHLAGMTMDGRFLVFQSNRSGSPEIWRASSDGSDLQQLTYGGNNTEPHVSPDGRWVVYRSTRDGRRALWRIALEGGDPVRLTDKDASWPRISPDGKIIACEYLLTPNSPPKLAIISIEGGRLLKVFDVPRTAIFRYGIRWMPDGNAVAYRDAADRIWKQSLDSTEPKRLEGLPQERLYSYSWSPDGKQFAFSRGSTIRDVVLIKNFK
ncbi:MAG TPA: DPP IV N-terminal domain-containing protein [Blastocatellia bacterium]|nr:DPP IV N-terminal domain-containing protein [Blastocatellia bacterium]